MAKPGRKKGDKSNRGRGGKTPKQFMNQLVPVPDVERIEAEAIDADFTLAPWRVDPVDFCLAVINNDQEVLNRIGVIEIPDIDTRLEAARIAAPYTNKKKPVDANIKHQYSWVSEITEAEQRTRSLRMDVNERAPDTTH